MASRALLTGIRKIRAEWFDKVKRLQIFLLLFVMFFSFSVPFRREIIQGWVARLKIK